MKGLSITLFSLTLLFSCRLGGTPTKPLFFVPEMIDSVTLIFSGDVMQHLPQVSSAQRDNGTFDYIPVFASIAPYWKSADFAIVNLETTLADEPPYYGYPMFRSPSAIVEALKHSGIDLLALANNHCVDQGARGVDNTIRAINRENLKYVGLSDNSERKPTVFLENEGFKIALLNYTYGTNGMPEPTGKRICLIDTTLIRQDYTKARNDGANHVVAFVHWGEEYQIKQNNAQTKLAIWLRNLGVDYVIGSHPHVVQPIDYPNKIVYSLGNFVSNQSQRFTTGGISIKVTLYTNGQSSLSHIAHWVDRQNGYIVRPSSDTLTNNNIEFSQAVRDISMLIN